MDMKLEFQTLSRDPKLAETFDVFMCNGYSLPSFAIKFLKEESASYQAREDDLYVISYPKTGTTWTQEIVYLIHSGLNLEESKAKDLNERFPYIEHRRTDFNAVKNMQSPRLLKTHLPYSLLPSDIHKKACKIIYVTRNPRDVAVSYFHFARMLTETGYKGTFDQFFERFIADRATYSPFLQHNLEFWERKNDKNILFLFYEDMQKNILGVVERISNFLGKALTSEEINMVINHCTFKSMAASKTTGLANDAAVDGNGSNFFRKGKVGDWKNFFSEEQISQLDQKVEQVLGASGLKYTYEI